MPDDPGPEGFDLDDRIRAIREADVLVVGFMGLHERLLVDARRNEQAGPFVRVVQQVRSPQERLRQLRELRPGFNDPESFVFLPPVARVQGFVEDGLFDEILQRCAGDETAIADCQKALQELQRLDAEDLRQALVGGPRYQTIYQREG